MAFIKVVKNKAYFKRFQVKYRRRRDGKTDYRQRRNLVIQDKNKYNAPKYRFVVRFTNKDIHVQIVSAKITGDVVLTAAFAHELPRFGIEVGLTNYAAAYCVGLLAARRCLTKIKLADRYEGLKKADGKDFMVNTEPEEGPRPFKCLLDIGLARTTTGAKVFAALKGGLDGGLHIPHSESRFVGFSDGKLDTSKLRHYLYGGHVADYMRSLYDSDREAYKKRFSQFIKRGIDADSLEKMYTKAHAAIRANPVAIKKERKKMAPLPKGKHPKRWNAVKRTLKERQNRIKQIKANMEREKAKDADDDDDDDEN